MVGSRRATPSNNTANWQLDADMANRLSLRHVWSYKIQTALVVISNWPWRAFHRPIEQGGALAAC